MRGIGITDKKAKDPNSQVSRLMGKLVRRGLYGQRIQGVMGPRIRIGGRWILGFVFPCYLGLNREGYVKSFVEREIKRWGTSSEIPHILGKNRITLAVEHEIAALTGYDRALLFPSTTHLAMDLLPFLSGAGGIVLMDERAYPTSRQGACRARQAGVKIRYFRHNDSLSLNRMLETYAHIPSKVIVCDGIYPYDGRPAALSEYYRLAVKFGASVYVDDAHGIGILGHRRKADKNPLGNGGGGAPGYFGLAGRKEILHAGSLSKAFGTRIAFVAAKKNLIQRFQVHAEALVHSTPPSLPDAAAALASLKFHRVYGNGIRLHLIRSVRQFRLEIKKIGMKLGPSRYFPIQTLYFPSARGAEEFAVRLRLRGVWSLLHLNPPDNPKAGVVRFVITALHGREEIAEATDKISSCI